MNNDLKTNLANVLFLYGIGAKNIFYIFKNCKIKEKKRKIYNSDHMTIQSKTYTIWIFAKELAELCSTELLSMPGQCGSVAQCEPIGHGSIPDQGE